MFEMFTGRKFWIARRQDPLHSKSVVFKSILQLVLFCYDEFRLRITVWFWLHFCLTFVCVFGECVCYHLLGGGFIYLFFSLLFSFNALSVSSGCYWDAHLTFSHLLSLLRFFPFWIQSFWM